MSKGTTNKVILIGNLGQDPEVKTVGDTQVANLSLATTESWKDKAGELQERTEWHRVSMWGRQAEAIGQYAKKGSKLYIEGKIETRTYEKDGEKRYSTEIKANSFEFLDKKEDSAGSGSFSSPPNAKDELDLLPF
jgi:single-strand DNA-binding protein